ncbi:DUF2207 family protein [Peptoniphilus stercorisuis]|uniref:Uncharacterized membrane protein YbaN (DUF454 family) n=1 Tax=Peptoniphilus stercorisuis TaxID=1436965 RepID=A0ABS4KF56_9FIRM|nr:DUF2207 domain-containing protein [Peptoniphilus stercorisuis]MBP2026010.1 uncharacterized membrane protein YbaN (DUF454 family) [Peptoniphilus stercorisuis]
MKKRSIILFLILIFIPNIVFGKSVEIENLNTKLQLEENGDYEIEENLSLISDTNMNGVYRTIYYAQSDGITNLKISSNNKTFKLDNKAQNGDLYKYSLEDIDNNLKIKIFIPWNEKVNVKISYTLNNAAIKGNDTGFISYNFMSKIDTPIKNFKGTIEAKDINFENLKVKADAKNSELIKDKNTITLLAHDLEDGDYLSINTQIPLESIKYSTNERDLSLSDLENFNENGFNTNPINKITTSIIVAFTLIISIFYKKSKSQKSDDNTLGHIMKLSPAEASSLILGNNNSYNFILATLLNFEREGYLNIYEKEYITKKKKKKRNNYIYKKTNKDINELTNSEKYLYNMLFDKRDTFSSKDLNEYRKDSSSDYNKKFAKYLDELNKDLINKGLKSTNYTNVVVGIISLLLSILFLVLGIVGIIFGNLLGLLVILLSVLVFYISIKLLSTQPALGKEQSSYYKEIYKKLSKEKNFENYSEIEKEKLIIYSIAFGLTFERINYLKDEFNINTALFIPLYWIGTNNSNMQKEMNRSFVGNESGVTSFGGGISSGGTGSTGGGSAGGF